MEEIKFSVTKNGKVCDPKHYDWDENTRTFRTNVYGIVIDFSGIDNVTIQTVPGCIIKCGENCIWHHEFLGTTSKLESGKLNYVLGNYLKKELLCIDGYIPAISHNIIWWKVNEKVIIKVGCQIHSLNHWKKNYKEIAKQTYFSKHLIPEYLKHLETIEASLVV